MTIKKFKMSQYLSKASLDADAHKFYKTKFKGILNHLALMVEAIEAYEDQAHSPIENNITLSKQNAIALLDELNSDWREESLIKAAFQVDNFHAEPQRQISANAV
jgi:hypothetical protein